MDEQEFNQGIDAMVAAIGKTASASEVRDVVAEIGRVLGQEQYCYPLLSPGLRDLLGRAHVLLQAWHDGADLYEITSIGV